MQVKFTHRCYKIARICSYFVLRASLIVDVHSIKLLGVTLSSDLKWDMHIENISTRCKQLAFLFKQLRISTAVADLSLLIESLLLPVILYAFPAWCNVTKSQISTLQSLVNRITRICRTPKIDLEDRMRTAVVSLYRNSSHSSHPLHFLRPQAASVRYSRRDPNRTILPRVRSERVKKHYLFSAINLVHQ